MNLQNLSHEKKVIPVENSFQLKQHLKPNDELILLDDQGHNVILKNHILLKTLQSKVLNKN